MPDGQTINQILSTYGVTSTGGGINWANIIGSLIFGIIGLCAFRYGKKENNARILIIGIILMVYPYFITNTWAAYAVGIGLTGAMFFWRE